MFRSSFNQILAPFIALTIIVMGHGLMSTYVPLSMHHNTFTVQEIGIVSACYYLGLVLGSFKVENVVARIGHIRAYAAFVSLFTALSLLLALFMNGYLWALFRLGYGITTAGLFVVIESWFLAASSPQIRGQVLSLYMVSYYGAFAIGQYLLNLEPVINGSLFILTALLGVSSIFPLAITRSKSPEIGEPEHINLLDYFRISPSSIVSAFSGGLFTSVVMSLLPIYISLNSSPQMVPYLMAIVILGGMCFQYPIGRLSDRFDRRKVVVFSFVVTGLFALFCYIENPITQPYKEIFFFIFGGMTSVMYPLGINMMCDNVEPDRFVAATQAMLLFYSIGCVFGPMLAPLFGDASQIGLFLFMCIVSCVAIFLIGTRILINEPVPQEQKQAHVAVAPSQTPVASELSPNVDSSESSVYEQC